MRTNTKTKRPDVRKDPNVRLAGGFGTAAAKQNDYQLLRRALMSTLLFEPLAYESGSHNAQNIQQLIPKVDPELVVELAIEARFVGQLRHAPLWVAVNMLRHDTHKRYVGDLLVRIINRPDELAEVLSLYWKVNGKRVPIANQLKDGLVGAFGKFNEYQLAKWNRERDIRLLDVMRLVHPTPVDQYQSDLWGRLRDNKLSIPDTWEVELSKGGDKKAAWTRLLKEKRLGGMALLMNLRNMEQANVDVNTISDGINNANARWLLPLSFIKAAEAAPRFERELNTLMIKSLADQPKLPGHSIIIVDVSGSMNEPVSGKSQYKRVDVAKALAMIAVSMSHTSAVFVTAGNDGRRQHATQPIKPYTGFDLFNSDSYARAKYEVGGGGIFTRQALEYIREYVENKNPERIIVITDSQDCDYPEKRVPHPFGKYNYIIDISAHAHGVAYEGVWTAEVTGWSERFINFINYLENNKGVYNPDGEADDDLQS